MIPNKRERVPGIPIHVFSDAKAEHMALLSDNGSLYCLTALSRMMNVNGSRLTKNIVLG